MKNIVRVTAFLFALIMLLSTVASCKKKNQDGNSESDATVSESQSNAGTEANKESGNANDTDENTDADDSSDVAESDDVTETESETEKETNEWGDEVVENTIPEDLNYNGAAVNIVIRKGQYGREWTSDKISDAVDLEVFTRNQKVQKELGVTFNFIPISDNSQSSGGTKHMTDAITKVGKSGGKEYDIVNQYRNDAGSIEVMPFYKNVRGGDFVYLDLDKPYWSQNFNKVLNTNGKQYFFVGDINLTLWDRAIVVFFNKSKLETYANVTEQELYQMVIDEQWTYETFHNMIKNVHEDATGDGKSSDDFFGLSSIGVSEASDGLLYSWNVALSETTVEGYHRIVTGSAKQKVIDMGEKLIQLYSANGSYLNINTNDNIAHFTEGHALFNIDTLYHNSEHLAALRGMDGGYGIVPTPMYDTDQGDYYTGVQDAHTIMSVIDGDKDYEMLSAVLDLLAYESYNSVRPYYVKVIIKERNLDDTKSGEMFDIIMDGVTIDFVDMFEGADPKTRWLLWRKPFQRTMGVIKDGELSFTVAFEEANGNGALDEKLQNLDLFLDRVG